MRSTVTKVNAIRSLSQRCRKEQNRSKNQVALITGASRGIGLAMANALAEQSCNLILTARNEKSLAKVSRELQRYGVQVLCPPCDVRDPNSVEKSFPARFAAKFRASTFSSTTPASRHKIVPIEKLPFSTWKDVLATNLDGTFLITQAALVMMRTGATIVNNLSIAATRVFAGSSAYNASKHGHSASPTPCAKNYALAVFGSSPCNRAQRIRKSGRRSGLKLPAAK